MTPVISVPGTARHMQLLVVQRWVTLLRSVLWSAGGTVCVIQHPAAGDVFRMTQLSKDVIQHIPQGPLLLC